MLLVPEKQTIAYLILVTIVYQLFEQIVHTLGDEVVNLEILDEFIEQILHIQKMHTWAMYDLDVFIEINKNIYEKIITYFRLFNIFCMIAK